jgi:hypothetical protein
MNGKRNWYVYVLYIYQWSINQHEGWNYVICRKIGWTGDHHVKQAQKSKYHIFAHMQNLDPSNDTKKKITWLWKGQTVGGGTKKEREMGLDVNMTKVHFIYVWKYHNEIHGKLFLKGGGRRGAEKEWWKGWVQSGYIECMSGGVVQLVYTNTK